MVFSRKPVMMDLGPKSGWGQAVMSSRDRIAGRAGILDRLFVGGCTATYVVLIATVAAALRLYAG
jgi:hypothetical protein